MMHNVAKYSLASLLLMVFSSPSYGEDIHVICQQQPKLCLTKIDRHLSIQQPQSRVWFEFQLYKLDALFDLVDFEQLEQEVVPWLEVDNIPVKFKTQINIYYAKILKGKGAENNELAFQYLNNAIDTLKDIDQVSASLSLKIKIANTLNSLGKYQQGHDFLYPLVAKYENRHMPKFKHELYENLGHFSLFLGKLDEHLQYRFKALEWAEKMNNQTQIAISLYNVARAHQELKQYDQAFNYFSQAEQTQALGKSDHNMVWFRRAEMALAQKDVSSAIAYFANLDQTISLETYSDRYKKLEEEIALAAKQE